MTTPDLPLMTVTQLSLLIRDVLRESFTEVMLVGEISRVTYHRSGHVYLTLKDQGAVIDAVIWRSNALRMRMQLEPGLEVVCRGAIDAYPPRGTYQFIIEKVEPRGEGALQILFRKLVEKLRDEGLFDADRKRPLPPFPERIGIITSPTGAAVRDMIRIIARRYPPARLLIHPVHVQGEQAAPHIAAAIAHFNEHYPHFDVLIVGRGGGSLEDLWPFNEEGVARAIFASRIPVVSAVGHETDTSVSDLVADRRAATPSEAAELVVPSRDELIDALNARARRLAGLLQRRLDLSRERLEAVGKSYILRRPETLFTVPRQRLDEAFTAVQDRVVRDIERRREALTALAAHLEALSPLKVLARGYSVTMRPDGAVIRRAAEVQPGDAIRTRLEHGALDATVTHVRVDDDADLDAGAET